MSRKLVGRTLALLALAYGIGMAVIALDGLIDRLAPADLIVVPGTRVAADGTPSPRLAARLARALDLYREGRAPLIVVSGGIGASRYDETLAMRDYLTARGVPAGAIVMDNQGRTTFETARFTARLMRERGLTRVLLVSQFFHLTRFRMAMQKHGVEPVGQAHAQFTEARDAYSLVREVPALVKYALCGEAGEAADE